MVLINYVLFSPRMSVLDAVSGGCCCYSRKLLRLRTAAQHNNIMASALHHTYLRANPITQRIIYEQKKPGTHFQIKQKSFRQRATGIELLILYFMNLP